MEDIYYEFENILLGNQDKFSHDLFYSTEPGGFNELTALKCIRYAIETILGWDEDTAIQKFDSYIINSLKLNDLLRYIDFPPDLEFGEPKYILSRLYPNKVKINQQTLTITTLKDVLAGNRAQFPRDYFIGPDGFIRYCYCIKYLLEVYVPFKNIPDIYEFFLSTKGNAFLSNYKLKIPTYQFRLSIFDAIRKITSNNPDGELYYLYYSFVKEYNKVKKSEK